MSIKAKLSSLGMTAAVLALTASGSWAATVCTTKTVGDGPYTSTTIAVASNFTAPAADLVDLFQKTPAGDNTTITICNNSTTALRAEIDGGTNYSMFFAADTTADNYNTTTPPIRTAFTYAKGIPVYFGYQTSIPNVGYLISGLTGIAQTLSVNDLSSYAITDTSTARSVAVASTDAPYGIAAHNIINSIEGTSLPGTIPAWVVSPLYANINLTFSAVSSTGGTIKSGFVSKAQICGIKNSISYVEFTGSNYVLTQKTILLNSTDSVASALNSYITGQLPPATGWNTFLTAHCYGTL